MGGGGALGQRSRAHLGRRLDRALRHRPPPGGGTLSGGERVASGDRALRAALWGAAGFALGYLLPATLRLPVLAYDPVRRAFDLTSAPAAAQMRYAGDLLWACALALGAATLARALPWRRPLDARVAAAAVLSLFALDVAFYLSRLLAAV